MTKSKKEIEYVRAAATITDQVFSYILSRIKPGITEAEIARDIETSILKRGAKLSFPVIVAFGKNTSCVHHLKASAYVKCRKQEIVLLDFGAKVEGYCSDMTRMVFVGIPKKEWTKAYAAVLATQSAVINKIQQYFHLSINESKTMGFSGAKMDIMARTMIERAGLPPYPHGLGHSLGREIHEHPKLNRKKDEQIAIFKAFTIEPATYIKGEYGIRIEDTVCLNTEGLELLTLSSKEMIIL